jgi:hypothetical protein
MTYAKGPAKDSKDKNAPKRGIIIIYQSRLY